MIVKNKNKRKKKAAMCKFFLLHFNNFHGKISTIFALNVTKCHAQIV